VDNRQFFQQLFKQAEKYSLEDFTDEDIEQEELTPEEQIVVEGYVRAIAGDVKRTYTDAFRDIRGWFQGINTKKEQINKNCLDAISWLKDKDLEHKDLDLDMGSFATWCKTSATFYWRYYFVLNDKIYNDMLNAIKNDEITKLETLVDFDMIEREKTARMLDSVRTIKDLIVIVERYRSRTNLLFEKMLARKTKIKNTPFHILMLGGLDLIRTVKKIVNLAI